MKRRTFIQQSVSVAGLSFVGCGLGAFAGDAEKLNHSGRRRVVINGKTMRTIDIHCHS